MAPHGRPSGQDDPQDRTATSEGPASSTVTLFGGAALARATQDEADRALEVLLRHGVNHIDTAARYDDSELRIWPWMARHRKDFERRPSDEEMAEMLGAARMTSLFGLPT